MLAAAAPSSKPWTAGRAAAAVVGVVALVLCMVAVLRTVSDGAPEPRASAQTNRERAKRVPSPPPPCAFNTLLRPPDVAWSQRNGTAHQLSIRGCTLKRHTHAQAKRCLVGKRLVFVGDSVTRYQYLTLVYFLHKGRWPAPLGGVPGQPSVANEHEWDSWNDFLRGSSALFDGRELCDCYRREYVLGVTPRPPESEKFENRFYTSADGATTVSHLTYTAAPQTVHGHHGFPPFEAGQQPCQPATCNSPADWSFGLAGTLKRVVRDLNATHVIVNSGLWGSSNAVGDDKWRAIAAAGLEGVSRQQGRAIWRTTTATSGAQTPTRDHDALAIKHAFGAGWALLDAYAITRPLLRMRRAPLWDGRHFQAVVYRELNVYLLNMICEAE